MQKTIPIRASSVKKTNQTVAMRRKKVQNDLRSSEESSKEQQERCSTKLAAQATTNNSVMMTNAEHQQEFSNCGEFKPRVARQPWLAACLWQCPAPSCHPCSRSTDQRCCRAGERRQHHVQNAPPSTEQCRHRQSPALCNDEEHTQGVSNVPSNSRWRPP